MLSTRLPPHTPLHTQAAHASAGGGGASHSGRGRRHGGGWCVARAFGATLGASPIPKQQCFSLYRLLPQTWL